MLLVCGPVSFGLRCRAVLVVFVDLVAHHQAGDPADNASDDGAGDREAHGADGGAGGSAGQHTAEQTSTLGDDGLFRGLAGMNVVVDAVAGRQRTQYP